MKKQMIKFGCYMIAFGLFTTILYLFMVDRYYKHPKEIPSYYLVKKCDPQKNDKAHNARMIFAKKCVYEDVGRFVVYLLIGGPLTWGVGYVLCSFSMSKYE